jgi:hypothetical protein
MSRITSFFNGIIKNFHIFHGIQKDRTMQNHEKITEKFSEPFPENFRKVHQQSGNHHPTPQSSSR